MLHGDETKEEAGGRRQGAGTALPSPLCWEGPTALLGMRAARFCTGSALPGRRRILLAPDARGARRVRTDGQTDVLLERRHLNLQADLHISANVNRAQHTL